MSVYERLKSEEEARKRKPLSRLTPGKTGGSVLARLRAEEGDTAPRPTVTITTKQTTDRHGRPVGKPQVKFEMPTKGGKAPSLWLGSDLNRWDMPSRTQPAPVTLTPSSIAPALILPSRQPVIPQRQPGQILAGDLIKGNIQPFDRVPLPTRPFSEVARETAPFYTGGMESFRNIIPPPGVPPPPQANILAALLTGAETGLLRRPQPSGDIQHDIAMSSLVAARHPSTEAMRQLQEENVGKTFLWSVKNFLKHPKVVAETIGQMIGGMGPEFVVARGAPAAGTALFAIKGAQDAYLASMADDLQRAEPGIDLRDESQISHYIETHPGFMPKATLRAMKQGGVGAAIMGAMGGIPFLRLPGSTVGKVFANLGIKGAAQTGIFMGGQEVSGRIAGRKVTGAERAETAITLLPFLGMDVAQVPRELARVSRQRALPPPTAPVARAPELPREVPPAPEVRPVVPVELAPPVPRPEVAPPIPAELARPATRPIPAPQEARGAAKAAETYIDKHGIERYVGVTKSPFTQAERESFARRDKNIAKLTSLSREELQKLHDDAVKQEGAEEVMALGEKGAQEWRTLQRQQNSSNNQVSDKASKRIDEIEASLTPEQHRILFGIGDERPSADNIKDLIDAVDYIDVADSPAELSRRVGRAIILLGGETDPTKMDYDQRRALAQLSHAGRITEERGYNAEEVLEGAFKSAAGEIRDPQDIEMMLGDLWRSRAPQAQQRKALTAPQQPRGGAKVAERVVIPITREQARATDRYNYWVDNQIHTKPVAESLAVINSIDPIKRMEGRTKGTGLTPFNVTFESGRLEASPSGIHAYARELEAPHAKEAGAGAEAAGEAQGVVGGEGKRAGLRRDAQAGVEAEAGAKAEVGKEPWAMTREERITQLLAEREALPKPKKPSAIQGPDEGRMWFGLAHMHEVAKALSEGKPVPESVLADYPDLSPKQPAQAKPAAEAAPALTVGARVKWTTEYGESKSGSVLSIAAKTALIKSDGGGRPRIRLESLKSEVVPSPAPAAPKKAGGTVKPSIIDRLSPEEQAALDILRKPLRGAVGKLPEGGASEEMVTRLKALHTVGKAFYREGLTDFKEWSAAIVENVGEWAKEHLDDIYARVSGKPVEGKEREVVGIFYRNINADRAKHNLPPFEHPEISRPHQQVLDDAQRIIEKNPMAGESAVEDILLNQRAFKDDTEVGLAIHRENQLRNARDIASAEEREAQAAGDKQGVIEATARINSLSVKITEIGTAILHAGASTRTARTLSALSISVNPDFSRAELERQVVDAQHGRPLTEAQLREVERTADDIKAKNTALERVLVEKESEITRIRKDILTLEQAVEKAKQARTKTKRPVLMGETPQPRAQRAVYGAGNKIVTTEQYVAMRERMLARMARTSSAPMLDPEALADLVGMATYHIESLSRSSYGAIRDKLREELPGIREGHIRQVYDLATNEKALAIHKRRLSRELAKWTARTEAGDYERIITRRELLKDPEAEHLAFQLDEAKHKWYEGRLKQQWKEMGALGKVLTGGREAIALQKAFMIADIGSAFMRQGGPITVAHPIMSSRSFLDMLRAFRSRAAEHRIMNEIRQDDLYEFAARSGFEFTTSGSIDLTKSQEYYQSHWAQKVPLVAGAERAFSTLLNSQGFNLFKLLVNARGGRENTTLAEGKLLANMIMVSQGRGDVGKFKAAAAAVAPFTFAGPRYYVSRIQMLWRTATLGQARLGISPSMRRMLATETLRSLAGFIAIEALMTAVGAKLGKDALNTDWGKAIFGRLRADFAFGMQQFAVFFYRLATGKASYGEDGKVQEANRMFTLLRFVRSKLGPAVGSVVDLLYGRDYTGKKLPESAAGKAGYLAQRNLTNIALSGAYQAAKANGISAGVFWGLMEQIGVGVSVFNERSSAGGRGSRGSRGGRGGRGSR